MQADGRGQRYDFRRTVMRSAKANAAVNVDDSWRGGVRRKEEFDEQLHSAAERVAPIFHL
jgi:hypothetical protein